ncbi:MAG: nucleotidyltransferase domain-containing protein [Deltaproteobacteria bacterium]|nr:nucleotidyltransferase domain-containing protein [Nannocystaceae bacterium]
MAPLIDANEIPAAIAAVLSRYPEVSAGWLFGSVARGTAGPGSDLDVGVIYPRGRDAHARVAPQLAMELARATGFERVDVVDLAAQGPIFAHRVLCDGRRVYEGDRDRRVDFESDTTARAFDFMPTYRIATADKPAALRRWLAERYGV